ncbi:universal stress protein [Mycobacterium sp. EPa45]|uniref:universal stress protein n=1 Tax=Mycobacterium sp. EPa45 TaxID=1545728 RepID=UPI00064193F7|nr:universal stress protein [Mycobacterium sp. EPa45]AKK27309.1 hypothetical protein AB431_12145 [Mycobacterium sp. EPa45]
MPEREHVAPAVVVGVDGSRWAIEAACWAVDEAVRRDIPLRLVYALDPTDGGHEGAQHIARQFAVAQTAVRCAASAVEATNKPVKIEWEVVAQQPVPALLDAARGAAMLCVGAIGRNHFRGSHVGSTAMALATAAKCPVTVVRGHNPVPSAQRRVAVELDGPTGDLALRHGFDEASSRGVPLRVLTIWHSRYTDIHDEHAVAHGNRDAKAALERRLKCWRKSYPDVNVTTTAVHGNSLSYLMDQGNSIQLLVVAHERGHGIQELLGAAGNAVLQHADCSVLICEPENPL